MNRSDAAAARALIDIAEAQIQEFYQAVIPIEARKHFLAMCNKHYPTFKSSVAKIRSSINDNMTLGEVDRALKHWVNDSKRLIRMVAMAEACGAKITLERGETGGVTH